MLERYDSNMYIMRKQVVRWFSSTVITKMQKEGRIYLFCLIDNSRLFERRNRLLKDESFLSRLAS